MKNTKQRVMNSRSLWNVIINLLLTQNSKYYERDFESKS